MCIRDRSSTVADGTVHGTGSAAVGAALGLNIVDQTTTATTGRDLSATAGGVSLRAEAYSGTNAGATASATGADKDAGDGTADGQIKTQLDGAGSPPAAKEKADQAPAAKDNSGRSISVAGALGLNLVSSRSLSLIHI